MTHPIITSSDASGNVQTESNFGENPGQWVRRHFGNVVTACDANEFPLGSELCTEWYDESYEHKSHCTTRSPGETDAQFRTRHFADTAVAMIEAPPMP